MIPELLRTYHRELSAVRHDFHRHPELSFKEERTSGIVAVELERLGYDVATGVAGTGVVGVIRNGSSNRAIAFRADMDALPIHETTGLRYASTRPGIMHACGHDGHTTILLGLARYLAETRRFNGTICLIFQPAEEDISGAHRMVEEGLFRRFPVEMVFALHNMPGAPVGQILVRPGAITAAADIINIAVIGAAGHGALPHLARDPVVAAASLVMALQTAVSRVNDVHDPAVLTVGAINGGSLPTAIPGQVSLQCGLRTTSMESRAKLLNVLPAMIEGHVQSLGCSARIDYGDCVTYPVGMNDAAAADIVRQVALDFGQKPADIDLKGPIMFSEDFAFMLREVPGCYFAIGNGPSRNLHDPGFDFNDELLLWGPAAFAAVAERILPLQ